MNYFCGGSAQANKTFYEEKDSGRPAIPCNTAGA